MQSTGENLGNLGETHQKNDETIMPEGENKLETLEEENKDLEIVMKTSLEEMENNGESNQQREKLDVPRKEEIVQQNRGIELESHESEIKDDTTKKRYITATPKKVKCSKRSAQGEHPNLFVHHVDVHAHEKITQDIKTSETFDKTFVWRQLCLKTLSK